MGYSEMTSPPQSSPLAKRRRKSDNSELFNTHGIKRDKLYCVCKTKYDPSKFYVGCDICSNWFHGFCVGILQAEAESIEEYVCPRCDPNSKLNYPNLKKLNSQDNELVKKMFKAISSNRNSQPFKEPVDPKINPKYYEIVKEPMDLQTIERK